MPRVQIHHKLAGQPYDIEDLDPAARTTSSVDVQETDALDLVSDDGFQAVGLPVSYPREAVTHAQCQAIGQAAYDERLPAIACRSAATGAAPHDEELRRVRSRRGLRHAHRPAAVLRLVPRQQALAS